jgi:hypothetical protein
MIKISDALENHEKICSLRYEQIEARLTSVELKIDQIHEEIDRFKTFLIELFLKAGIGLVVALAGTVWAIKF